MNFATPKYQLTDEDRNHVYDPAEDTFLLLDSLENDVVELRAIVPNVIVEVGSGSGVVSSFILQILDQPAFLVATDINRSALQCTRRTALLNSVDLEAVLCDLLSPLYKRLQNAVDVLIFNPPYVNTDEIPQSDLALSWTGGPTGRGTVDRLVKLAPQLLSPYGVFYVVALKTNDIPSLLNSNPLLSGRIALERRCGCEHLFVLKFRRKL